MNDHDVNSPTYWRNREDGRNPVPTILGPQPIDHASAMAQQDPAFPDYDERGWPSELVCAVNELREHAARVMEIAAALRTTNALRAGSLHAIANSLEVAAITPERYMTENAGPGLASAWRPIATAPRDGRSVVLRFGQDGVSQGKFVAGLPRPWKFIDTNDGITWLVNHAVDGPGGPSHWQPMPSGAAG
jgi:hypothetical protein